MRSCAHGLAALAWVLACPAGLLAQPRHGRSADDVERDVRRSIVRVEARDGDGAGVIVGRASWVVTAHHLIGGDVAGMTIELTSGTTHHAHVLLEDPEHDLVLLEMEGRSLAPPIATHHAAAISVGQAVLAPLAGRYSLASGTVRAVPDPLAPSITTDIQIEHDSCGGPLVDDRGRLVGLVNDAALDGGALAVPYALVAALIARASSPSALEPPPRAASTAWFLDEIGVVVRDLPGSNAEGVIVESVSTDSPAAHAGISGTPLQSASLPADLQLIVAVGDVPVHVLVELELELQTYADGATVALTLRKGADERVVQVTLAATP